MKSKNAIRVVATVLTVAGLLVGTSASASAVSDLTPGYDEKSGTGSINAIFADPGKFWDRNAGSVSGLGAMSVQMTARP